MKKSLAFGGMGAKLALWAVASGTWLWSQPLPCCGAEKGTTLVHEDFESYLAGEVPVFRSFPAAGLIMNPGEPNGIMVVPGGVGGKHALAFFDNKSGVHYCPELTYETPIAGHISISFDFLLDTAAPGSLQLILRDLKTKKTYLDLCSLAVAADGAVSGQQGPLGKVAKGCWHNFALDYVVGAASADVRVTTDGKLAVSAAIPAAKEGAQADQIIFCGIGNEKGSFQLDNIRISGDSGGGPVTFLPLAEVMGNAPETVPVYDIPLTPVTAGEVTLTPSWGAQDAQAVRSAMRQRICLNGLWAVQPSAASPVRGGVPPPKAGDWAFIKVPHWISPSRQYFFYGEDRVSWKMPEGSPPRTVWYARDVTIPSTAKGERVYLDFSGLLGYAVRAYWNGRLVGELTDQLGGRIDLTPALTPGKETKGQLVLYALSNARDSLACFIETGLMKRVYRPAETSGLMDVYLSLEPTEAVYHATPIYQGARAMPSVRRQRLNFQVDCRDDADGLTHAVIVCDREGKVALRKDDLSGRKLRDGVISLRVPWDNARCWTPDDPYLYTFVLQARDRSGKVVDETLPETFGFREVWTESKNLMLNGQPLRLRVDGEWVAYKDGATIRRFLSFMKDMGFNCVFCPPAGDFSGSEEPRGNIEEYFRIADEMGMLAIPRVPYLQEYQTERVAPTLDFMDRRMIARLANHPSVIAYRMWMVLEVGFAGVDLPDIWGIKPCKTFEDMEELVNLSPQDRETKRKQFAKTKAYIDGVKALDPSRLTFEHTGVGLSDVSGAWSYWNWLPTQEYSDRVKPWAEEGVMPIGITEGGLPYTGSFLRHGADDTMEPMLTEYSAMRLGPQAYLKETRRYLDAIRSQYDPRTKMWPSTYSVGSIVHDFREDGLNVFRWEAANTMAVWAEHNQDVYRAWRTYGVPGGRDPFHGLFYYLEGVESMKRKQQVVANPKDNLKTTGMKEDRWWSSFATAYWQAFPDMLPPGSPLTPTGEMPKGLTPFGESMWRNDSPLLVYIAGQPEQFTAKDHVFWSGERVGKQVAAVWDGFRPRRLAASWTATLGGERIAKGELELKLEGGDILFRPLEFALPQTTTRKEGVIALEVKDRETGKVVATDSFAFQAYPPLNLPEKARGLRVALFDPRDESRPALRRLGLKPRLVTEAEDLKAADLLVIGRGALPEFGSTLLAELPAGLPVLVLEQKHEVLETLGFRAYPICTRTVFPLPADHPALKGVAAADLRDWRVDPQLLPEGFDPLRPGYNYHIGNRGTVASVTIETPTRGNFTPLLQTGCDLRETPLLEWMVDGRRWLFCQLSVNDPAPEEPDFENSPGDAVGVEGDPVAARILANLLEYVVSPAPAPVRWGALGTEEDMALLRELGADDPKPCGAGQLGALRVAVVGKADDPARLKEWVEGGGTAVVLPQDKAFYQACLPVAKVEARDVSLIPQSSVPPGPTFFGLVQGDFHYRQALPCLVFPSGANVDEIAAGKGRWILVGFDPRRLKLAEEPWLIMSYRHQCRALAQILTNAGVSLDSASHAALRQMPVAASPRLDIAKTVGARMIPKAAELADAWVKPGFDDQAWAALESYDNNTGVGHAYLRIRFQVPANVPNEGYLLDLGTADDYDETYLNGVKIGSVNPENTPESDAPWAKRRLYPIPPKLLKPGKENLLAIYVWNRNSESLGWKTTLRGPISIHVPGSETSLYMGTYCPHDDPYIWRSW